ncbi:hypothetical protein MD484_g2284, partial [Candolleomyces efflorescens]
MFFHQLPQDIIDMIIDHTKSDFLVLKALSLVSKAWSQRTRKHLFCDIKLRAGLRTNSNVPSFLVEQPSLRRYVQSLTIQCGGNPYRSLNDSHFESTLAILPLLESLTTFSIRGEFSMGLVWTKLLPRVQIALYEFMASPRVISIALSWISDIDIVPLLHLQSLEELVLDSVQVPDCASVESGACFPLNKPLPSSSSTPGRLRRLEITRSPQAFRVLLAYSKRREPWSLTLSNLTHLKITWLTLTANASYKPHEFAEPELSEFFDLCGGSIESYTVDGCRTATAEGSFPPSIIPIHRFSNLKEIYLTINIQRSAALDDHAIIVFGQALEVFSRAGTETSLTTIDVRYNGCSRYIEKEVSDLVDQQRWKWLDETLQRPAFTRLTDVIFREKPFQLSPSFRQTNAGDLFLGAYLPPQNDTSPPQLIGYVCSTLSPEEKLTHESMSNHVAGSSSVCIHSVCVAKSQRRKGIALQLLKEYITRLSTTSARGSPYKRVLLIAHEELRPLYEKAGFTWLGKSDVTHGSRPWYEMRLDLNGKDAAPQIPPDVLQNLLKPSSEKHNPTLVSDCHHGIEDLIMSDSEGTAVNKYDLLCPRGCRSVILKKGVAQWTERTSVMREAAIHF